jgi:hypothetical protein
MKSIRSSADMAWAVASPIDADLRRLLVLRRDQLLEHGGYDLGDLAHFIVVEPGDTISEVEGEAGVAIATNLVDGTRYGEPGFTANFEFVQRHDGGWLEAVTILSDDGFGVALLVRDCPETDPTLLALLRDRA